MDVCVKCQDIRLVIACGCRPVHAQGHDKSEGQGNSSHQVGGNISAKAEM
jgi:hypothetical protein